MMTIEPTLEIRDYSLQQIHKVILLIIQMNGYM